jgi:hypothetical protein
MATYFMFNEISERGLDVAPTLLRADRVGSPEYNVFNPDWALTRLPLKGRFLANVIGAYFVPCRTLPPKALIEQSRAERASNTTPTLAMATRDGQATRLWFGIDDVAGAKFRNVDKTPDAFALDLKAQGHHIIRFPLLRDYKQRYGVQ